MFRDAVSDKEGSFPNLYMMKKIANVCLFLGLETGKKPEK